MPTPLPDNSWLTSAIREGFLRLTALSLSFQPGPDVISATMQAWTEALIDRGIVDRERDTGRVHAAFRYLAANADTWPSPNQLVACLPEVPREYFRSLPKPEETREQRLADHQRRRQIVNAQREALGLAPLPDYDSAEDAKPAEVKLAETEEERRASRITAERHIAALRARVASDEQGRGHG